MSPETGGRACSLFVLLASRSPAAVIYRRGPSRHTALIGWDRATDTFEVGQWFKGSIYPDRSAIAPDGKHLLTFMGTFRPPFRTWTVLSRPPYVTALALWPKGDTWGGGGSFLDDRTFALDHNGRQSALAPGFSLPDGFVQLPPGPLTEQEVGRALARDPTAWQWCRGTDHHDATDRFLREGPSGYGLTRFWWTSDNTKPWKGERRVALRSQAKWVELDEVRWADFDPNGDLLFTIGGRLYRCVAADIARVAGIADLVGASRLLADFTGLTFRALQAPYGSAASEADAPEVTEFAPVLDRVTKDDRRRRQKEQRLLRRPERERESGPGPGSGRRRGPDDPAVP